MRFFVEYDGACSEGRLGGKPYKQNVVLPTEESFKDYRALQRVVFAWRMVAAAFFSAHACGHEDKLTNSCRTEAALPTSDQTENTAQKNEQGVCCCSTATNNRSCLRRLCPFGCCYLCCYDCCYYCFCRYRCCCHYCDCSRFSIHDSLF